MGGLFRAPKPVEIAAPPPEPQQQQQQQQQAVAQAQAQVAAVAEAEATEARWLGRTLGAPPEILRPETPNTRETTNQE